jgi:isoquinoline 1-oxidoreductase beta subunit
MNNEQFNAMDTGVHRKAINCSIAVPFPSLGIPGEGSGNGDCPRPGQGGGFAQQLAPNPHPCPPPEYLGRGKEKTCDSEGLARGKVTRRGFLQVMAGVGAGLTLGYFTRGAHAASAVGANGADSTVDGSAFAPSAFLKISPEGVITVAISKSEMGQGVRTSLAMLVAEELDADWTKVHVTQAPGNGRIYGSMQTVGSGSIRSMSMPLRRVGAGARFMLVSAAAKMWGVDAASCTTENGKVLHAASGKSAAYGELAAAAAKVVPPAESEFKLKDRADFKIIGKPMNRVDNPAVVVGAGHYAMDIKVDGMLYAIISRKPVFGATLQDFDDSAARKVPGVVDVVRVNSGVAVLGRNTWAAMKGAEALKVNWNLGPNTAMSSETIRASLVAAAGEHPEMPAGAKVVEATYDFPYLAHCTMEPLNAVADVRADRCTIWAGSQNPDGVRSAAAQLLKMAVEDITVNSMLLGGGFGRRSGGDYVMEAADLSQKAKAPVKLIWTKEDDLHNDNYRTTSFHSFRGAVSDGNAVGWSQKAAVAGGPGGRGGRGAGIPYNIPNAAMTVQTVRTPIPTGYWRSVEASQFCPANECFIDELAHAAGKDPFEFRKGLIRDQRLLKVLEMAAQAGNWGAPLPAASGRGIACFTGLGSFAAHVAEISLKAGKLRIDRVVCVCDCGQVINPKTVEAQMQGACVDALATALKAAITIENGTVVQNSWPDYQWMYMADMPKIEVVIIDSAAASGGIGELGYPSVMPAVANALFAAGGKRVRKFPIRMEALA